MINHNPIQQLKLDLEFIGIEASNNYLFDKASDLSKGEITQILSDFFDDPKFDNLIYQFDLLEFDLGSIPYKDFQQIFIERFKKALEKKFKDIFENNQNSNEYQLKNNSSNTHELIKYYLLNGRLPWWSNKLGVNNIFNVIQDYIASNPKEFKLLLLEIGEHENVRKRIAYNFSESLIKLVIQVLTPNEFQYIFVYHDYVVKLNNEQNFVREAESSVSKAIWYNIITYLLTERSSVFEKKEFLKRNLISAASYFNLNYYSLLQLLNDSTSSSDHSFNTEIYNFIKDIRLIFQEEKANIPLVQKQDQTISPFKDNNTELTEVYLNYIYIVNYYLTNGSLPIGFETLSIDDIKQIFQKLYAYNSAIISKLLLKISINSGTTHRIYNILSASNYKFAIDVILNQYLNIDLNQIHKSFIQLLITNNRSTSIYLTDKWKQHLLHLVYTQRQSITIKHIFQLYLTKYANEQQITLETAIEIYVKELRLQQNSFLLNKLIESQHIEIEDIEYIEATDIKSQSRSIYDLVLFLIEHGYMPWWGADLIEHSFRSTLESHFISTPSEYIQLLKYAGRKKETTSRFLTLLGEDKVEQLLIKILKDENMSSLFYFLKNYTLSKYSSIKSRAIVETLWYTQVISNYGQIDPVIFIRNILSYLTKSKLDSLDKIIFDLIHPNQNLNQEYIDILKNFLIINTGINSSDKDWLPNFENQIKSILNVSEYNITTFENFIYLIANETAIGDKNLLEYIVIEIINNILLRGNYPPSFQKYTNLQSEPFLLTLLDYLYVKNQSQLKAILLKFDLFNEHAKYIITDWIFNQSEIEFVSFMADNLLPLISNQYQYLINASGISNSIFIQTNQFSADQISNYNQFLNIKQHSTENEVLNRYEAALQKFLLDNTLEQDFKDQESLLKFLISSIYAKGANFLLTIFNQLNNNLTAKNTILKLFSNAVNFQEKQIYNSLISSMDYRHLVIDEFIDDFAAEPIIESLPNEIVASPTRLDLKAMIIAYSNQAQISDKADIEQIKFYLAAFFNNTNDINSLQAYLKADFYYYLKLMIFEIVKSSPADFLQLLNSSINKEQILKAYRYLLSDISNLGITTIHIFKDYFESYLQLNVFKTDSLENEIENLMNGQKSGDQFDLHYLLNSELLINKDTSVLDSLFFGLSNQFSIHNMTMLKIVLKEMKNSFSSSSEKQYFDIIVSRTILNNVNNIRSTNQPYQFLDIVLNELKEKQAQGELHYLNTIVKGLKAIPITHPYTLVKLINFVVDKSNQLIQANKSERAYNKEVKTNDSSVIENALQIKKEIEFEQKELQKKITEDPFIENKNDNEVVKLNETIYVNNIGLILFHLFIPTYFNRLNLLNEEGEFIDIDAKYRAVHLLQILVSDTKYDEHELVLNKILCNLEITEAIPMEIELSEAERNLALELNKVVLQRWEKMSSSSLEHFRAAFLMRDGRLNLKEDGWYMTVEKRGYDIILSTLPWAFGVIKFKWMPKFLYTEWT